MRSPRYAAVWLGFFTWALLWHIVYPKTNSPDVSALNVMYSSLNSPSKLSGWKSSGGDPCGDSWQGITCSGSSVTEINLSGLGLSGSMGYQLSSLTSVTYFDLSKNNLKGDIPYQLPPNALHIDLSRNGFTNGVPYSFSQMSDLKYLNLGHNKLNGQLNDMFGKLPKISTLDLSYNSLTGNLPSSFRSLSSLNTLYLQNNQFTGPIVILADLPLDDLNISNNKFTGWIPDGLKSIKNINTDGNSWSSGPAPPGSHHSQKSKNVGTGRKQSGLSGVAIAGIVVGALLAAGILIAMFLRKSSSPSTNYFVEDRLSRRRSFTSLTSQELGSDLPADIGKSFKSRKSFDSSCSISMKAMELTPPISTASKPPSIDRLTSLSDNNFANRLNARRSTSFRATCYSLADLQTATGNFATGRLLGLGSIGRVYRAKYPDGKVLAIKKIDSSLFNGGRVENFSDVVSCISGLHHPNIAEFLGYCSDQGHNMLVYEYFRNGSLHEFLHLSDDYSKPFTWNTRVRTALGTARAIEYLHEACSPSLLHKNIKSSNILLDNELNPRLSECGLAPFYQCSSQNLGVGYNPPECTKPSAYTTKSDVYCFGVVMLELLTGRMPFDSSRTRAEQSLVRWAVPQLRDIEALGKMVDPALRGLYPPKSISRFADIISGCVQSEGELRPSISEVVQTLLRLVQSSSVNRGGYDFPSSDDNMDYY